MSTQTPNSLNINGTVEPLFLKQLAFSKHFFFSSSQQVVGEFKNKK